LAAGLNSKQQVRIKEATFEHGTSLSSTDETHLLS
jgi:hypothetical protein